VRRSGHRRVEVADLLQQVGGDVAGRVGVHEVRRLPRGGDADDRGQRLVRHADAVDDVLGDVAVARDDHHDGLADVLDLVAGEGVAGARLRQGGVRMSSGRRSEVRPGQVVPGVDADEAVDLEGVADVDAGHAGMGVRAADEGGGVRVVAEVVEVAALPARSGAGPRCAAPVHRTNASS
jgi:hypothetical protein